MGSDRYGLDWNVWGGESRRNNSSEGPLPYSTPEPSPPQEATQTPVEQEETVVQEPLQQTVTLRNPRFIPDDTTRIGNTCAVAVDISGETQGGSITFELYAVYKEREHHFSQFKTVSYDGTTAETELFLETVDAYDVDSQSEPPDSTLQVDYFFTVTANGAQDVTSSKLTLPYLDSAQEQIQRCTAQATEGAAQECSSSVSTCTTCTKCESGGEGESAQSAEASMQDASAHNVAQAAESGSATSCNCSTCSKKDECSGNDDSGEKANSPSSDKAFQLQTAGALKAASVAGSSKLSTNFKLKI